ncbi:MAG: glycosyl hydrolase 115 family protein [Clostridia bacterium]|nr:glycosyl hydrolase 115 family protein [Clostridia bacterium]
MENFVFSRSTVILADETIPAIQSGVELLKRDMRDTLMETGERNVIRAVLDASVGKERYQAKVTPREILLTCGDDLGAMYALLSVSERILGIRPLDWWMGVKPKKQGVAAVPCSAWESPSCAVRYRCWFVNDEVLFTGWHQEEARRAAVWKRLFETILRCGGNMVIAGTDREYDGHVLNDLALDMGLWITQHHTEVLGARMFGRLYPDLQPSYTLYPDLFEGLWREAAEYYAGRRVVWTIGFRGQGDKAFWHDDADFDTDEKRGEMISKIMLRQMEIVREKNPDAHFSTNLYGEMMSLYRQGYLQIPSEVIKIWGDNGFGKMVSRRQGNHNPRTDAMPDRNEPGENGIYYHISFYDLQAANHITPLQIPPREITAELEQVLTRNGDTLWNINVGSVKPHTFMLDIVRRLWTDGHCDPVKAAREFAQTYFGSQAVAPLLLEYGEAAVSYGPYPDDRAGDQFYHFPLRALARALMRGETDKAVPSLCWAAGDASFRAQVNILGRIAEKGVPAWRAYNKQCRHVMEDLPEEAADRVRENLLLSGTIHEMGCLGLYAFCQACVHTMNNQLLQAYLWTDKALTAAREALASMRAVSGRFAHIYDNDCFVGVGLTAQVLENVRGWLRVQGDGEMLYDWEKRFLTPPEENRVVLQTHRTVQLSDDELCLRLRRETDIETVPFE